MNILSNTLLADRLYIDQSGIEKLILRYKNSFVQLGGYELWQAIIDRKGIPVILQWPDEPIFYVMGNTNVKKRFNCKPYIDLLYAFPVEKEIQKNKNKIWFRYTIESYNELYSIEPYTWIFGLHLDSYNVLKSDYLFLD